MTKKEKLYREWKELQFNLGNTDLTPEKIDELINLSNHEQFTVKELSFWVEQFRDALIRKEFADRNNRFLNETEEGRKFKEEQELLQKNLMDESEKTLTSFRTWVTNEINAMTGNEWTVSFNNNSVVEIGIQNTDPKRKFTFEFGYSFSITYDTFAKVLKANYGTLGAFELLNEDNKHIQYLSGMTKVLNDRDFLASLKSQLEKIDKMNVRMWEEYNKINYNLTNAVEVCQNHTQA